MNPNQNVAIARSHLINTCVLEIHDLLSGRHFDNWLLSRVSARKIIETFTSIPVYTCCDEALWELVHKEFKDDLDITDEMYHTVSDTFQTLMDTFYSEFRCLIGDESDKFVFSQWLGTDSIVMVRRKH